MRRLTAGLLAGAIALAAPTMVRAQTIDAGPVQVEVTGYAQFQWNTTSVDEADFVGLFDVIDEEIAATTFETRRIRPTIEVVIDDWIEGKIQPDFALGDLDVKDAYVNFAIDETFELRVGQFKKPFSAIELTSSTRIIPIERGLRIRGLTDAFFVDLDPLDPIFIDLDGTLLVGDEYEILDELGYLGRDIGIAAHGSLGRWGYAVGLFNGSGADRRDDNDGKSVAARLEYVPSDDWPLVFGAATSYREFRFDGVVDGLAFDGDDLDGLAFEVDGEWGEFRRPGAHLLVEGALGDNVAGRITDLDGTVLLDDEDFFGVQGILAYFAPHDGDRVEGWEPLFRVSYGNPNGGRDGDGGMLVTPGINVYFFGRNRIMLNGDIFFSSGDFDTEYAFRAQAQLHY